MNNFTYAIVKLASFKKSHFDEMKLEKITDGKAKVATTSLSTMRQSIDGKFGIIKWLGDAPPGKLAPHLVQTFSHGEILSFLNTNSENWESQPTTKPIPVSFMSGTMAAIGVNTDTRAQIETVAKVNHWRWVAVVAAAGGAYLAYSHFLG